MKGSYSWKPAAISIVAKEFSGVVIWMDAGNLIEAPLSALTEIIEKDGFFSPTSQGTVGRWCHPKVMRRTFTFGRLRQEKSLNGALIGFDIDSQKARIALSIWKGLAVSRYFACPPGVSLTNHRFDQSLLSIVAYRLKLVRNGRPRHPVEVGVSIHNDVERGNGSPRVEV
jgi:hypothetical protein